MMSLNGLEGSKLKSVAVRLSDAVVTGTMRIGRYLSVSMGHDVFWPQRTLSVSIEQGGLKVVCGARLFSRITIRGIRQYAFEPNRYPQPDALVASVKLAAVELHASLKNITLMVPSDWVIARTIELPSTVTENLQAAVSFELDRFTPLSVDNAIYDFLPISKNEETIRLFLALCRADIVNPYIAALEAESITVGRITTRLSAAGAASSYIANAGTLVFVEVRNDGYSGGVILDGRISGFFADVFNGEGPDARIGKIREELSRAAATISNGTAVAEAVMVRDGSISSEAIKRSMASAIILNDLERKRLHPKEPLPGLTLAEMGSVIESLWPRAQGVDLLAKGERKRQQSPVALTVLLLFAIAAMTVIYAIAPLTIERRRVEEIQRQIALLKEPVRQVEALKKAIEAQEEENRSIEGFKSGRVRVMDVLREVTRVLPKNAWLTRARITDNTVELEGYAGSAADTLPKLEASPFLKKVEFASPTFRDTRQNADRFVIKMEIENEKKPDTGGSKNEAKK